MVRDKNISSFKRRICVLDLEPRRLDSIKHAIEKKLHFLPQLDYQLVRSIEDPGLSHCDLVVIFGWHLDESELLQWLSGFESRWLKIHSIWVPALIISQVDITKIYDVLEHTVNSNWYFDILHPDHLSSIPLRVANLLRIHDHLQELNRYERESLRMQSRLATIEKELEILGQGGKKT